MITPHYESMIVKDIVRPTIAGLSEEGIPYTGFLYFGLMLTASGPMVLEYNCRLGDPETQPLMMRMDFDLALALEAAASRKLHTFKPAWKPGASVCVVMASGGYPGPYETGKKIEGLEDAKALPGVAVFHAGTKRDGDCDRDQRRARAGRDGHGRFAGCGHRPGLRSRGQDSF